MAFTSGMNIILWISLSLEIIGLTQDLFLRHTVSRNSAALMCWSVCMLRVLSKVLNTFTCPNLYKIKHVNDASMTYYKYDKFHIYPAVLSLSKKRRKWVSAVASQLGQINLLMKQSVPDAADV